MEYRIAIFNKIVNGIEYYDNVTFNSDNIDYGANEISKYLFGEQYYRDNSEIASYITKYLDIIISNKKKILISVFDENISPWENEEQNELDEFIVPAPEKPEKPTSPIYQVVPQKPRNIKIIEETARRLKGFDYIKYMLGFSKIKKLDDLVKIENDKWDERIRSIEIHNSNIKNEYHNAISAIESEYQKAHLSWEKEKLAFNEEQIRRRQEQISYRRKCELKYSEKENESIHEYYRLLFNKSQLNNDFYSKDIYIELNIETKTLYLEILLPSKDDIPNVESISYNKRMNKFVEKKMSDKKYRDLYETVNYQIVIRMIYEVFHYDVINAIDYLVINAFVNTINKSTGQIIKPLIMSVSVPKNEFLKVDIRNIDAKSCFKSFKGISASSLEEQVEITPVLLFNKNDNRFIESKEILGKVTQGDNLASMDWQEFEHLVRELFEKEFSVNGGEVKVTQSSRDGGVDAIAFDPDIIRGGKIVIQAKRYTNTVTVSAVRDLYGTVHNEGAIKGILITTSDYGPDAYEFAKGKPITLLNGGHLLNLIRKHGQNAFINIKEAKKHLKELEKKKTS